MVDRHEAIIYMEPEKQVVSRSGDECVVALCDQWYLDYGNPAWKQQARDLLSNINTLPEETRKNFEAVLDWLHEYACSRQYGLGTRLPWAPEWVIESLSDSTVYMAFYTVAHLLLGDTLNGKTSDGSAPGALGIEAKDLTPEVWDYILLKHAPPPKGSVIAKEKLDTLRNEFNFWYPVDLRCSGKDLIPNHLTYYIYNHCAIWDEQPENWPKAIRCNGHLLLNNEKMSKSTGNFLTLSQAIEKYSADGVRFSLADAGDAVEDANFVEKQADAGLLRLYNFLEWTKETLAAIDTFRKGPTDSIFADRAFDNQMKHLVSEADRYYNAQLYKEALRCSFFEYQDARDKYRELCGQSGMHAELVRKFIETQAIILSPICPHICEEVWSLLRGPEKTIMKAHWPEESVIDDQLSKAFNYLMDSAHDFRVRNKQFLIQLTKPAKGKAVAKEPQNGNGAAPSKASHATIFVAKNFPQWQEIILATLKEGYETSASRQLPDNKEIAAKLSKVPELKKYMKKVMPFAEMRKQMFLKQGAAVFEQTSSFDEMQVLQENIAYIRLAIDVDNVEIKYADKDDQVQEACPLEPTIVFKAEQV